MSATKLLGQFLGGNASGAGPAKGKDGDLMRMLQDQLGSGGLERLLGSGSGTTSGGQAPSTQSAMSGLLSGGVGKAALAGGVLGVLLKGGKKPKKMAISAAKMGGLGLVAGLAWRAYQQHQQGGETPSTTAPGQLAAPEGSAFLPANDEGRQRHARAILRAMIAAAKADGHVDDALEISFEKYTPTWADQKELLSTAFKNSFVASVWQSELTKEKGLGAADLDAWQANADILAKYEVIEEAPKAADFVVDPSSIGE